MCQNAGVLGGVFFFFFFNDTATTEIYTLSLHDALPICDNCHGRTVGSASRRRCRSLRSEEHTSELQSPTNLVCRLLLEKKNKKTSTHKKHLDETRDPHTPTQAKNY